MGVATERAAEVELVAVTVVAVGEETEWVVEEAEVGAGVAEVVAVSAVAEWRARTTQGQKG